MASESDFWACRVCRSINPRRSGRCYSCHTPREVAAAKPTELSVTSLDGPAPTSAAVYRSSETRAVIVSVATVVFILGTLASLWLALQTGGAGEGASLERLLAERGVLLLLIPVLGAAALIAYGAWISRVVENLPALGAGYSSVSATFAFVEPLIPGVNIVSLPARVGEVVRKLESGAVELALIVGAWLLLVGPPVAAAIILRLGSFVTDLELVSAVGTAAFVVFILQAVGLILGVVLIWRVERLCRARAPAVAPIAEPAST